MPTDDSLSRRTFIRPSFKKSRNGCKTCKSRKVKCDEARPICGQCSRRFEGLEACEFELPVRNIGRPTSTPLKPTARGIGCRACKERKVKCDNARPLCGNCARRFRGISSCDLEMSSSNAVQTATPKPRGLHSQSKYSPNSMCPLSPTITRHSNTSRTLELRLLHHYMISTCSQFPRSSTAQGSYVWAISIPQLAFGSELVLNALLGISALHLWALNSNDKAIELASRHYFQKAVQMHRRALGFWERKEITVVGKGREQENNDEMVESAEALLATAILITHHSWVMAPTHSPSDEGVHEQIGKRYQLPLQTYYMARGVSALTGHLWPQLKDSRYLWYVESEKKIEDVNSVRVSESEFFLSVSEDLASLEETLTCCDVTVEDREVYKATIQDLKAMSYTIAGGWHGISESFLESQNMKLSGRSSGFESTTQLLFTSSNKSVWLEQIRRRLATMPLRLPPRYLELAEQHDPLALALLVRNLALLKMLPSVWWLHGAGKFDVTESAIRGIRSLLPSEWVWVMNWPQRVIAGDNLAER